MARNTKAGRKKKSRNVDQRFPLTEGELKLVREELANQERITAKRIVDLCMLCTMWALRNKENYGKKRLERVHKEILAVTTDILERRLTPEDIQRTLAEETGFEVV